MRLIATILALFFAGSAVAQEWKEYENHEYSFAIHFPGEPVVEAATYHIANWRLFQSRVFSVEQETGVFR